MHNEVWGEMGILHLFETQCRNSIESRNNRITGHFGITVLDRFDRPRHARAVSIQSLANFHDRPDRPNRT